MKWPVTLVVENMLPHRIGVEAFLGSDESKNCLQDPSSIHMVPFFFKRVEDDNWLTSGYLWIEDLHDQIKNIMLTILD